MSAEDVVTACFRGPEAGEAICPPGIEDPQGVEALDAAERAMIAHARVTTLAVLSVRPVVRGASRQ